MDEEIESQVATLSSERARLSTRLEKAVWKIHSYAREHADSLDSERHCAYIRAAISTAVIAENKFLMLSIAAEELARKKKKARSK